jgi:hypothetical protein
MKLGYDNVLDNHSDPSFWQKKQASILKCSVILYEGACIFLSASIFTKYLCQSLILIKSIRKIEHISCENTLDFMKNKNPLSEIMSPHYESFCDFSQSLIHSTYYRHTNVGH